MMDTVLSLSESRQVTDRRLLTFRLLWLLVVLASATLYCLSLSARQAELNSTIANLSPVQFTALQRIGFSPEAYAGFVFALEVIVPVLYLAITLVIFWQRSADPTALLISAGFVAYIAWVSPPLDTLMRLTPEWRIPSETVQALGMVIAVVFLYIFPDGRFVPRWTRYLLLPLTIWAATWVFLPGSIANLSDVFRLPFWSFALDTGWWVTGIAAQLYRFVKVANPEQRQQTQWVLLGAIVGVLSFVVISSERFARPLYSDSFATGALLDLVVPPLYLLTMVVIPLVFTVAICRYRLWDIEFILNQAFVYGILTAILGGLYTASITFSQRIFVAFTGERSDAAIVLTTLVVASAFTPVRSNLQGIADRHLKQVPDPTKSLKAFGDHIRSVLEVFEVEQMTRRALNESVAAFDATCGAVYLLRDGRFQIAHSHGDWNQVEGMSAWLQSEDEHYGWIALGPRHDGRPYSNEDHVAFARVAELAAQAIRVVRFAGEYKPSPAECAGILRRSPEFEIEPLA